VEGSYEHGNEPSGSMKGIEFLDFSFWRKTLCRGAIYECQRNRV
jgi:hypothetical protein